MRLRPGKSVLAESTAFFSGCLLPPSLLILNILTNSLHSKPPSFSSEQHHTVCNTMKLSIWLPLCAVGVRSSVASSQASSAECIAYNPPGKCELNLEDKSNGSLKVHYSPAIHYVLYSRRYAGILPNIYAHRTGPHFWQFKRTPLLLGHHEL